MATDIIDLICEDDYTYDSTSNKRKKRLINKIDAGIKGRGLMLAYSEIIGIDGFITFTVPTKDMRGTHNVSIKIDKLKPVFQCDCTNSYFGKPSEYCIHITSLLIYMCREYILAGSAFMDDKNAYLENKKHMDEFCEILTKSFKM